MTDDGQDAMCGLGDGAEAPRLRAALPIPPLAGTDLTSALHLPKERSCKHQCFVAYGAAWAAGATSRSDLVQDRSREPRSSGTSGAGGRGLFPGAGVASGLQVHASPSDLSSRSSRSSKALRSELCIFSWGR